MLVTLTDEDKDGRTLQRGIAIFTIGIDVLLFYVFLLRFKALKCIFLNFYFMLFAIKLSQHGLTEVYSCRNSVVVVVVVLVAVFVVVVVVVIIVVVFLLLYFCCCGLSLGLGFAPETRAQVFFFFFCFFLYFFASLQIDGQIDGRVKYGWT